MPQKNQKFYKALQKLLKKQIKLTIISFLINMEDFENLEEDLWQRL